MRPHHHKNKNLVLFLLGITLAFTLIRLPFFTDVILRLGELKYVGAFLGGLMFVSTFTLPLGVMVLLTLTKALPLGMLILFASLGAVAGDMVAFKFIKTRIKSDVEPLYQEIESLVGKNHIKKIIHTKYFAWTLPVIGAFIMASPLPDELGVSLMGLSNMSARKFAVISWFSHTIGIAVIISTLA